jgi:hypothetical protein
VQVLEDQQERLLLTLAQQHAFEGIERALAALGGIELHKRAVFGQGVQEREQCRDRILEGRVERHRLPSHLGPDGAGVIVVFNMTVALEQVNDREVRRCLAIGHRGALQDPPPLRVIGMHELVG